MAMKKLLVITLFIGLPGIIISQVAEGYTKSIKIDLRENTDEEVTPEGKYYALLIGVEDYQDSVLFDLNEPINDVNELNEILVTNYSFDQQDVTRLENPSYEEMVVALDALKRTVGEKDNLLIFYAGHGIYDETSELGFWLPSDADSPEKHNSSKWFRNSALRDYLKAVPSKHTLLISDACFSGSIFAKRAIQDNTSMAYYKLYSRKSRKAMTSGSLKPVRDKSVFMKYLKQRLLENKNKYLSSEELFSSFKIAVMNNSNNIPSYGEIQDVGDEGGDFLFIRRAEDR